MQHRCRREAITPAMLRTRVGEVGFRVHTLVPQFIYCALYIKVTFLFSSSIEISAWILLIKLCSIATASSSALPPIRPTMLSAEGETGVVQGLFRKYIYH